jgi:hypothetical protein
VVSGEFRRVNPQDTIFLSFQYAVPSGQYVFSLSGTKEGRYDGRLSITVEAVTKLYASTPRKDFTPPTLTTLL